MNAEVLRRAAALMRERAEDATFVYAPHHPKAGQQVPWFDAADAYSFDETDGPHIMGWSPVAALAVADLLDIIAAGYAPYDPDGPGKTRMEIASAWADNLARAYLGESA